MNSKNTIYVCMMSILLLMATQVRSQTTHIVDNNPNTAADFTDLQNAIDAAADNDTIHVQQSDTGYGDITLDKSLTIIGRSHNNSSYKTIVEDIDITSDGSNSTIKGLDVQIIERGNGQNYTLSDLVIVDCEINFVSLQSDSSNNIIIDNILIQGNVLKQLFRVRASNTIIQNNVFRSNYRSDKLKISPGNTLFSNNIINDFTIELIGSGGLLTIDNCIFVTESSSTETINFSSISSQQNVEVRNSISFNYGSGNYNFQTGNSISLINNQENVDPLFRFLEGGNASLTGSARTYQPWIDDLTLQPSSPVVDDGLYEGYDFKPLGTPNGFPSVKIDAYDATVPVNGDLNVTIKAKAN